jgi:hypothetical protein
MIIDLGGATGRYIHDVLPFTRGQGGIVDHSEICLHERPAAIPPSPPCGCARADGARGLARLLPLSMSTVGRTRIGCALPLTGIMASEIDECAIVDLPEPRVT